MTSEVNPSNSIFYQADFWSYLNRKVVKITYHDGTVILGKVNYKKDSFPKIAGAMIYKPGMSGRWLGDAVIDTSQVKKVEVE